MRLIIGEKIKQLRQEQGLTQEQLAEALNISSQAVSKWENAIAYPDITLVPAIAEFFGISCDALLTDEGRTGYEEIESIIQEAENSENALELLQNALKRFPKSYKLMLALSDAYSKQNVHYDRILLYCRRIYEHCPDLTLKYSAVQILCYIYRATENYEGIKKLAAQMPEIYQTRPALMFYSLPGDEIYKGMEDYLARLRATADSIENVLKQSPFHTR